LLDSYLGELSALTSSFLWAAAALLFTHLGRKLEPLALNLLKCSLALCFIAMTMWALHGRIWPSDLGGAELGWLALSGLVGLSLGDTAYFAALVRLGPRRTLLLWALAPPVTAILAVPVLGEPLTAIMAAGIALTAGGVAWVIRERSPAGNVGVVRSGEDRFGLLVGVAAAGCQATGGVLAKLGGGQIDAIDITVVRLLFGSLGLLAVVTLTGRLRGALRPLREPAVLGAVVLATTIGTFLGIWLSMAGLRYALVGVAATLNSTSPIFILPLAAIFLKERISLRAVLGACLAVAGIAVLFLV
jgi:drug/metabolite transporter (DMT)-like permease